jgi:hypothetical protein
MKVEWAIGVHLEPTQTSQWEVPVVRVEALCQELERCLSGKTYAEVDRLLATLKAQP